MHVFPHPQVIAVSKSGQHRFSKTSCGEIRLIAGVGVDGDAHAGETVKHRSRVAANPLAPNLRQVHLLQAELLDELATNGFALGPGDVGENILTRGVDLLGLARGTLLRVGADAIVEITGLRNPCAQLDAFRAGLTKAVLDRSPGGELVRKAGVMGIVASSGRVRPGDRIEIVLSAGEWRKLEPV